MLVYNILNTSIFMINKKTIELYKTLTQKQLNEVFIDSSCFDGHLEIVKYLLTSADLKEHANIHAKNDEGFTWTCNYGHLEIVKYLILDMSIEKTKHIKHYLKENQDNKCVKEAIELFKIREFNQKLNANLEHKEKQNKLKI